MIYFDSAATTLQKPPAVSSAILNALKSQASPGRGGYRAAAEAAETAFSCREMASELFHVSKPEQVILTFNATHGLNLAIRTLVKQGSTVLISGYEHNAVTRTLAAIPDLKLRVIDTPLFEPEQFLRKAELLLTRDVDVVICNHVSNVFGYALPVYPLSRLCAERGTPLIVDASQSAGVLPVHLDELQAAFIAMPGHKGLYGPQGTGLLLCARDAEPLLYGGTGSYSRLQTMPDFLPDRLEAGTPNIPGVAGLLAGMRFVQEKGIDTIANYESGLAASVADGLQMLPGVRVFRGKKPGLQTGVVSFQVDHAGCEELGEWLGKQGIAVRAGLHCAPLAHQTAGTTEVGTVRASFSAFNKKTETAHFLAVMKRFCSAR